MKQSMTTAKQTRWWAGMVAAALLSAMPACGDDQPSKPAAGSGGAGGEAPGVECSDYCDRMKTNCGGDFVQYASDDVCLSACAQLPGGALTDETGNTAGCRLYHANAAAGSDGKRAAHCPPGGPGGAGSCGADCEGYCSLMLRACTEFDTMEACLTACAGYADKPPFSAHVTTGDNLQCRLYHASLATTDPIYCAPAGAAPAGTCVEP